MKKVKAERQRRKKTRSFDPDAITTRLHQALCRDLVASQHEYDAYHSSIPTAKDVQVKSFMKKYLPVNFDQSLLDAECYGRFFNVQLHLWEVNKRLPSFLATLPSVTKFTRQHGDETRIFLRARALFRSVIGRLDTDEWFNECKNSIGSSIGVPYMDTSLERKMSYPLSTTGRAKDLFECYLGYDPLFAEALEAHNKYCVVSKYEFVEASRATTVDKDTSKRRMICIEPTVNMYLQQGLMLVLYKRLREVGLDVEYLPDIHKELARIASLTLQDATIDWSDASNCVSISLLEWLSPPDWWWALDAVRCPRTQINGEEYNLQMFATMGNATTFPIETLVFWAFAVACVSLRTKTNSLFPEWEDQKSCSVFGDDCILPSVHAPMFIEVLSDVGFMINDDKSYYGAEPFRESCGGDYLSGFDIRPFKIKAPQSCRASFLEPWLYVAWNALIQKYISYFGTLTYIYDKELWKEFLKLFKEWNLRIKLVPSYYPDDSGLKLSADFQRFVNSYGALSLSPISVSNHGTYSFTYLRFVYKEKERPQCHALQYAVWLKKPRSKGELSPDTNRAEHHYKRRRIGGYVVAKGVSSHWEVPYVKSVG